MSDTPAVAVVKKMYEAFGRGDIQTILDLTTDDVEWVTYGPGSIPYARAFKGKEGVAEFFRILGSTQQDQRLEDSEYICEGDQVVSLGRYTARVRETGKSATTPIAHVFTIRNGKCARFLDFFDTAMVAELYSPKSSQAAS